jgi:hypothetical protein
VVKLKLRSVHVLTDAEVKLIAGGNSTQTDQQCGSDFGCPPQPTDGCPPPPVDTDSCPPPPGETQGCDTSGCVSIGKTCGQ